MRATDSKAERVQIRVTAAEKVVNTFVLTYPARTSRLLVGRVHLGRICRPSSSLRGCHGRAGRRAEFVPYFERPHLRVYVAEPHYLLAMKCAAMRIGKECHDLDDVRFLLRHLDGSSLEEAPGIVGRYFDEERLHPKTRLALEEILAR